MKVWIKTDEGDDAKGTGSMAKIRYSIAKSPVYNSQEEGHTYTKMLYFIVFSVTKVFLIEINKLF